MFNLRNVVLAWLCTLCAATADQRPNIVLVMADDQGWGEMAYQGHPVLHTPNFDRAAAEGLRLDRFYAAAPVCSLTRASVLAGRHPNRMGVSPPQRPPWLKRLRGLAMPPLTSLERWRVSVVHSLNGNEEPRH